MPYQASTIVGGVIEGELALKNGELVFVEDSDGPDVPLKDFLEKWHDVKIRITVGNLEMMNKLVEAGMLPGMEAQFLETISDEELETLVGDDSK